MPAVIDIAPGLQADIMSTLTKGLAQDKRFLQQCDILASGRATYQNAHIVSQIAGEHASDALMRTLRPEILPDHRLYYNIGQRTIRPALEYANSITGNYCETMQTYMNQQAGMNIKAIKPRQNKTAIDNICGMASDYENFADGRWVIDKPVQTNVETIVDRFVRANAYFAEASGMGAVIVRTAEADCCPWCADLEGTYDYAEVRAKGSDVYRRHNNCRCVTEYYPGSGNRVQDTWAHSFWRDL